jgi:uncharacterized membrane protein YfcA
MAAIDPGLVTLGQYLLVAVTAFSTGIIGGIAGYGTGLLMPLVLVPIVGAEAVVPIIAVSALFTNASRLVAFWKQLDGRKAVIVGIAALPTTYLTAWGYTRLTGPGAAIFIGSVLITLVVIRRMLKAMQLRLASDRALALAGVGYGAAAGGTAGAGVILLSILMWAGLEGPAVIATDAAVSLLVGVVKAGTFLTFGALPLTSWIMALLIGASGAPGAFIAKRIAERLTLRQHIAILDTVVVIGGLVLIWQGLRGVR